MSGDRALHLRACCSSGRLVPAFARACTSRGDSTQGTQSSRQLSRTIRQARSPPPQPSGSAAAGARLARRGVRSVPPPPPSSRRCTQARPSLSAECCSELVPAGSGKKKVDEQKN
eukprot:2830015-Pleurochrysis_carterae.AAC.2